MDETEIPCFTPILINKYFNNSHVDPCAFIKYTLDNMITILFSVVHIVSYNKNCNFKLTDIEKSHWSHEFKIKDLRKIVGFLDIQEYANIYI